MGYSTPDMGNERNRLDFDENGIILARDDRLRDFISRHAGRWSAVSAMPGLLLLRSGADREGGVLLSGEIKKEGWLIEIISFVCNSRQTGKLVIMSREVKRELYFDNGSLRLASSTAKRDLLGEFILSEGLITKEQLDAALMDLGPGKRLGQVLVDKEILTRHEVYSLLHKKIEKIFLDSLVLHDGIFYFDEEVEVSKLPASICIDTQSLLMDGLTKRDELVYYRETVPRPGASLEKSPNVLEDCSTAEKDFVVHVDGSRTLADIDAMLRLGDFETVRIARHLAEKGLIDVILDKQKEQDALRSVVDDFNLAIVFIYETVKDRIDASELSELGAEFLEKSTAQIKGSVTMKINETGELDFRSIKKVYSASEEKDKLNFVVMILSRYISFILFTANSYLPLDEQELLSEKVYGRLDRYS
jgi:hypothetical protein